MASKPKPKPRTGQPRIHREPLVMDRLPMEVLEAVKRLRGKHGLTWDEIERLSSLPYSDKWEEKIGTAGFVNWEGLPTLVLELFPTMRLSHATLHRWYDLRVEQAQKEIDARGIQADKLAAQFAAAGIENADEAVTNALRRTIFVMLQESGDDKSRAVVAKALLALRDVMNGVKANAIKERKVATEEQRVEILKRDFELKRRRFDKEMGDAAKKVSRGQAITKADIDRIRERVFGLGPAAA